MFRYRLLQGSLVWKSRRLAAGYHSLSFFVSHQDLRKIYVRHDATLCAPFLTSSPDKELNRMSFREPTSNNFPIFFSPKISSFDGVVVHPLTYHNIWTTVFLTDFCFLAPAYSGNFYVFLYQFIFWIMFFKATALAGKWRRSWISRVSQLFCFSGVGEKNVFCFKPAAGPPTKINFFLVFLRWEAAAPQGT